MADYFIPREFFPGTLSCLFFRDVMFTWNFTEIAVWMEKWLSNEKSSEDVSRVNKITQMKDSIYYLI